MLSSDRALGPGHPLKSFPCLHDRQSYSHQSIEVIASQEGEHNHDCLLLEYIYIYIYPLFQYYDGCQTPHSLTLLSSESHFRWSNQTPLFTKVQSTEHATLLPPPSSLLPLREHPLFTMTQPTRPNNRLSLRPKASASITPASSTYPTPTSSAYPSACPTEDEGGEGEKKDARPARTFPFLRLPSELRNKIYSKVFSSAPAVLYVSPCSDQLTS